jgi:hypothetical protein
MCEEERAIQPEWSGDDTVEPRRARVMRETHMAGVGDGGPSEDKPIKPKGRPRSAGGGRKPSKPAQAMPEARREEMRRVARFMRRAKEDAGMTLEQIEDAVIARYVRLFEDEGLGAEDARAAALKSAPDRSMVARFMLEHDLTNQSDFGFVRAKVILEACGKTIAMLDEALRLSSLEYERLQRQRELESVLLTRFHLLSPMAQRWLLQDAQKYAAYETELEKAREESKRAVDRALRLPPLPDDKPPDTSS